MGSAAALDAVSKTGNAVLSGAVRAGSKLLASNTVADSMISWTNASRLEPIASIDSRLSKLDLIPNLNNTLLNLYISYYTMSLSLDSQIGNVKVLRRLDKFATTRTPGYETTVRQLVSSESLRVGLPIGEFGVSSESDKGGKDANGNPIPRSKLNDLNLENSDDYRSAYITNKVQGEEDKRTIFDRTKDISYELKKEEEIQKLKLEMDAMIRGKVDERDLKKREEELERTFKTLSKEEQLKYEREIKQMEHRLSDEYIRLKTDAKRIEKLNEYAMSSDPEVREAAIQSMINKRLDEISAKHALSDVERQAAIDELNNTLMDYEVPPDLKAPQGSGMTDEEYRKSRQDYINDLRARKDRLADHHHNERMRETIKSGVADYKAKKALEDMIGDRSYEIKDMTKLVSESINMTVGKLFSVTLVDGASKLNIEVSARLTTLLWNPTAFKEMLSLAMEDYSTLYRWKQFRAGEIRFWADFVAQTDRIDRYREAINSDHTGFLKEMHGRARKNFAAMANTGSPSIGTVSAFLVISTETLNELELTTGKTLEDFHTRESVFSATYAMFIVVIDPHWETIVIYTRGVKYHTDATAASLKTAAKDANSNLDPATLMKMLAANNMPKRF